MISASVLGHEGGGTTHGVQLHLLRGGKGRGRPYWRQEELIHGSSQSAQFSLLLAEDIGPRGHKPWTAIFLLLAEDTSLGRHRPRKVHFICPMKEDTCLGGRWPRMALFTSPMKEDTCLERQWSWCELHSQRWLFGIFEGLHAFSRFFLEARVILWRWRMWRFWVCSPFTVIGPLGPGIFMHKKF